MWFIFLVLLKYGLITDSLFIYNLSGTCPLRKVREAPFWHADLFLLMLGMCSIFYYKKHNALNLPCFLNVLCNHLKKNECCAYFGSGKNYLIEFSPYQIASRDQGGVDFCTCHLALLWVSWGSLWKGGPPWTQRASWVGLKSLKLQDMRRWVFETNPLFPKRSSVFGSGFSQDDLILMDMVTFAASLEASYDSASQTCTCIAVTGGLLKQFPELTP